MKGAILNDECMHCNDRECHDGEHFCNQAMKENSFYKNAKLYKGLEVIQRPTYAELEAEVKEWKDKADLWSKTANLKDHNIMINKELEKHNEELIALINAERKRQEQCDDIHLRKIAELEKENAELKTRVSEQSERISELTQELDDKINRFG